MESKMDRNNSLLITLPISSLEDCSELIIDQFTSKICRTSLVVTSNQYVNIINNSSINASSNYLIQHFYRDFESQMFYLKSTNQNLKNIIIERFPLTCTDCNITIANDLNFRMCYDQPCSADIYNSSIPISKQIGFHFSLENPILNLGSQISQIQLFLNGEQMNDANYTVSDSKMGSNQAKSVSITFHKENSLTELEFKIFHEKINATNNISAVKNTLEIDNILSSSFPEFFTVKMNIKLVKSTNNSILSTLEKDIQGLNLSSYVTYFGTAILILGILIGVFCLCRRGAVKTLAEKLNNKEKNEEEIEMLALDLAEDRENLKKTLLNNAQYSDEETNPVEVAKTNIKQQIGDQQQQDISEAFDGLAVQSKEIAQQVEIIKRSKRSKIKRKDRSNGGSFNSNISLREDKFEDSRYDERKMKKKSKSKGSKKKKEIVRDYIEEKDNRDVDQSLNIEQNILNNLISAEQKQLKKKKYSKNTTNNIHKDLQDSELERRRVERRIKRKKRRKQEINNSEDSDSELGDRKTQKLENQNLRDNIKSKVISSSEDESSDE